ncbi:hypothetical protein [Aquimarina sp. 2201CG5-10]|uniref:hypothetical protein n=1 Tax=Aquimarina callyspongiae TaxID=3098150 RepID=UPI002AB3851F|nr:hypothetical protein [Aquimarina sp. 2201CG5-10]MDY8134534.1 hypothetical protein [Aquimarina sp. 2201CG5-10]
MKKLIIKFNNWEYWPFWILYIPVFVNWIVSSIRLRSFLYFTTINPQIETGGFVNESKIDILKQIPEKYIPRSILVTKDMSFSKVLEYIKNEGIIFPLIAKPNIGERGYNVHICATKEELKKHLKKNIGEFIIQDFVSYPLEVAVLYYKYPNNKKGVISSVCKKKFLTVTGNGIDNVRMLMKRNNRAILQVERFEKEKSHLLEEIPEKGKSVVIEFIGNHTKGTMFLDANDLIDEDLVKAFDQICNSIPNLNYGRFDIKCASIDDLKKLQNFAIMEINGVSGEPAHIYDPKHSFFNAVMTLLDHWKVLFRISKNQIENGVKPMKMIEFIKYLKRV